MLDIGFHDLPSLLSFMNVSPPCLFLCSERNVTVCESISTDSESLLSPIHLEPLSLTASSLQMIPVALKVYVHFMLSG